MSEEKPNNKRNNDGQDAGMPVIKGKITAGGDINIARHMTITNVTIVQAIKVNEPSPKKDDEEEKD